jgi:hypothetical protein
MLKKLITLGFLAASLSFVPAAHAQANPTATRLSHLQLGAGYSYARTDYGHRGDKGFTIYGDYDIGVHYGLEGNYHDTSISTPEHISERSFTVGPRFILRGHHFKLYGKGFLGLGHLDARSGTRYNETDFLFGGGGGVEYLAGDHLVIRPVDVEYQRWSFRNGLTPLVLTVGAAYRF